MGLPGVQKSLKFIKLSSKIKVSPLSVGSSYSNPLGHPLGALLAPNSRPRWPQEPPRRPQDGSKTHQDASKQAPGALQDPSNNAKEPSRAAKRLPRAPGTLQGSILTTPGTVWGSIWTPQGGPGHLKTQDAPEAPRIKRLPGALHLQDQGSYSLARRDSRRGYNSLGFLKIS